MECFQHGIGSGFLADAGCLVLTEGDSLEAAKASADSCLAEFKKILEA